MKAALFLLVLLVAFVVVIFHKKRLKNKETDRLRRASWQKALHNRLQWEKSHRYVNRSHYEYQELLQIEIGAFMLWLEVNRKARKNIFMTGTLKDLVKSLDDEQKTADGTNNE